MLTFHLKNHKFFIPLFMIKLERKSPKTGKTNSMILDTTKEALDSYYAGEGLIQVLFPQLNEKEREFGFVVHRTMSDPKWLDPDIDPNGRKPNWCFLGDPKVVNNSPIGLARYCSLRSWMSQWSYDYAKGDGINCAKNISVPTLVIGNTADDGITP